MRRFSQKVKTAQRFTSTPLVLARCRSLRALCNFIFSTTTISYAYTLSPTTGLPISRRTVAVVEAGLLHGMKVSSSGLIFAAVFGGVDVYHPDGTRLGRINIPEASPSGQPEEKHVVNLVFEGNNLWCFASGGVYRVPGLLVEGDSRLW